MVNFVRVVGVLLVCSIGLSSTEIDNIHYKLKSCKNYKKDNDIQQGILNWMDAVDSIEGCDEKKINFILSNKNRLTVKSNLSLLKSQYEFCDGVVALGEAFKLRESKILKMKKTCNNRNKKAINYAEKIKKLNDSYQQDKQSLAFLKKEKQRVDSIIITKNKEAKKLENRIEKVESRIKKIESTLRELEQ